MSMRRSEVVIVGGGVIGAASAYELARQGVQVTLLEKETPGYGASGRNMGMLWTQGKVADLHLDVAMAARSRYDTLVDEIDDFEFKACGGMTYFFEHQADVFPSYVASRRALGLPIEMIDAATARDMCPVLPEDVGGAVYNSLDAHVNPPMVTESLIAAAQRHGATVLSGVEVTGIDVVGGVCQGVKTTDGAIAADTVIVAAGAWSTALMDALGIRVPIEPMRMQIVETEPLGLRFDPVLYGPSGIKGFALSQDLEGYDEDNFLHPLENILTGVEMIETIAQRRDGSVLIGCPGDFAGMDQRTSVSAIALLLAIVADNLPALRDVGIQRTWAGLLPQTPDAIPIIDRVPGVDGLVIAAGHVFGQMMGPLTGELISQLVLGKESSVDMTQFGFDRW